MQKPTNDLRSTKQILLSFNRNTTREYILSTSVFSPARPPSRVSSLLFSANCLIRLICSNRILHSVFSGQTFHSTGGASLCTFPLFLMAGPFRHWTHEHSLAQSALSLPSHPLRVLLMVTPWSRGCPFIKHDSQPAKASVTALRARCVMS